MSLPVTAAKRFRVSPSLADRVRSLHPTIRSRIRAALENVLANPDTGKELHEELSGLRSYRVGRYRIIYRVKQDAIVLVNVGARSAIYEETAALLAAPEE